jgi:hypothetical protein
MAYAPKTLQLSGSSSSADAAGQLLHLQRTKPVLRPTRQFSAYCLPTTPEQRHAPDAFVVRARDYGYDCDEDGDDDVDTTGRVRAAWSCPPLERVFARQASQCGFCIVQGIVPPTALLRARKVIKKFARRLIGTYDAFHDEFSDIDMDEIHITRMPRIGRGKHNIHFDADYCDAEDSEHGAAAALAAQSHFGELLSAYMGEGKVCTLRETGISLTRPALAAAGVGGAVAAAAEQGETTTETTVAVPLAGEGMEWHSDGGRGEATVLLALEDVQREQGCLRLVPASHSQMYVDGTGHEEDGLNTNLTQLAAAQTEYCYRAGQPCLFDARTLHSVAPNESDTWRCVVWYIFDSY